MSLIEGFGDDFLYLAAFLGFIGIVLLAWLSTNVSHLNFAPTLLIIERRTRRRNDESERSSPSSISTNSEAVGSSSSHESDSESPETEENPNVENQNESSTTIEEENSSSSNESLKFIIKFLNDTQRSVSANPNDTISKVKQCYFADELANDKIVRFIYQGRELHDRETVKTCNIREQTIIHCQISTRRNPVNSSSNENRAGNNSGATDFDTASLIDTPAINLSGHFVFILSCVLIFFWFLRIRFRLLFSPFSTIVLIVATLLFLIFTLGSFLSSRRTTNQSSSRSTILIGPVQHAHAD